MNAVAGRVRFVDYPSQFAKLRSDLLPMIDAMLSDGDVMMRHQLTDFEENFAKFVGTAEAVGVSSCTDAMHLTLRAVGVTSGDEVITVSHTFVATISAIHHAGATPVLVDIEDDHTMSLDGVRAALSPRTVGVMPVHLNGRLCDMQGILKFAEKKGLFVLEDAAQGLGASQHGVKGGAFGVAGCFSFYPAKLLGTYGDAGAVTTNDSEISRRVRLLRNHGREDSGEIAEWSFNCRMDNIHAAILDLKLKLVESWIHQRRSLAAVYHEQLSGVQQLHLPPPPATGDRFDTFQNFEVEAEARDDLKTFLDENGVETMIPWGGRSVHQFRSLGLGKVDLPRTEAMMNRALLLPMHCELDDSSVQHVAELIRQFYGTL